MKKSPNPQFDKVDRLLTGFVRTIKTPDLNRVKTRVMTSISDFPVTNPSKQAYKGSLKTNIVTRRFSMPIFATIMLSLILGAGGLAHAANTSGPESSLWGLDQALEQAELHLTSTSHAKLALETKISEERMAELKAVQDEESTTTDADKAAKLAEFESRLIDRLEAQANHMTEIAAKLRAEADTKTNPKAQAALTAAAARLEAMAELKTDIATKLESDEITPKEALKQLKDARVELNHKGEAFRMRLRERIQEFKLESRGEGSATSSSARLNGQAKVEDDDDEIKVDATSDIAVNVS